MRLDFLLWLAGTKLAEAFQWIFSSRPGLRLALAASAILLFAQLTPVLFNIGYTINVDTAEYLHAVYALERGEVPYRDFPQNHPMLLTLLLLQLQRLFGATDVIDMYLLSKAFVGLHIVACFILFVCVVSNFCKREFNSPRSGLVFIMALSVLGMWWHQSGYWRVGPEWIALFYAYLAAVSHLIMMGKIIQGKRYAGWLILGVASCGLAAAVSPKFIYIIVPYMMTLCLAALAALGYWLKILSGRLTSLFLINVVFAALSFLSLVGFVALELWATGASMMDYIHSNYTMNGDRFVFRTSNPLNPFVKLRHVLDLPMVMVYILLLSYFPLLLMLHDRRKHLFKHALLFVGLTILFNASFPVYSNGITWNYYFIPSAMAIALYIAVVIVCLLHCVAPGLRAAARSRQRLDAGQGLAAFQLALAFIIFFTMAAASVLDIKGTAGHSHNLVKKIMGSNEMFFKAEKFMPPELRYWTFKWNEKPVASPVWGYFVQFRDIRGFWRKLHKLGVAPDPAVHWRTEYDKSPPDAIAVRSLGELKKHARQMKDAQYLDIGWLLERVRKEYSCISRGLPFYVRNDLAQDYLQKGWAPCGGSS